MSAAIAAAFAVAVMSCSSSQVRRAQADRAPLGDRLYAEVVPGEGGTIVFIPGLLGTTRFWRAAGPPPTSSRLIYVDPLGFGRSPWPDVDYSLDDHLGALRRTLSAAGATSRVTIVAHSFGTVLAAYYAVRYPGDVDRLILFGTPVFRNAGDARDRTGAMSFLAALSVRSPRGARAVCTLHNATAPVLQQLAPLFRPDLPDGVAEDAVLHLWPSLNGSVHRVLIAHPIEPALRALGAKVVLVHGRRDTITPLAEIRAVTERAGAGLVVTSDEHSSYWQQTWSRLPVSAWR